MHGTDYDAIVVGLGALGSAAAYHLARRGKRVLGLEAQQPGHTLGSSHGESRIIRMAYFEHPKYVVLLRRAYSLWEALQREADSELLRIAGGLFLGPADGVLFSGSRRSAELHHLQHELLDAAEVRRRFPVLHPREDDVALFEPSAGILFPERCIEAHLRLAALYGADTHHREAVRGWHAASGEVEVETAAGRYRAGSLVLTAGAWLGQLVQELALPLRPERNVVFWLRPRESPAAFEPERFPIYVWDTGSDGMYYGIPHLARPGVKVARHHTGQFCDPDTVSRETAPEDEAPVRAFVRRFMPDLDGPVASSIVCLYTNTLDDHFVVDRHPMYPKVVFAGGCSGHGFKFATVLGEVLTDLALTGKGPPAAEFLRVGRASLRPATGVPL
jgi:sarcosine oxidase